MAASKKESDDLLQAARRTTQEEKLQAIAELRSQAVDMAIEAANYAHLEMCESLGNPYGPNGRAALAMMKLAPA